MRCRLVASLIACLLLVPLPKVCDAWPAKINLAPLLYYESNEKGYDLSIAGPVLETTSEYTAVRPLFYRDTRQTDLLYPLGHSEEGNTYLVPVYKHTTSEEETKTDVLIFLYGRRDDEGYGGVFPFYGDLTNRFGHNRLQFVLWPVYTKITDDDRTTYSLFWPFLKYSEGREFQIFPFYGYEKTVNYRQYYYLWPFILHRTGRDKIDAFLPFYYYTRGDAYYGISVIWPLFTYNHNTSKDYTSFSAPWPLVHFSWGPYEEKRVWPFYWYKNDPGSYRMNMVLWPFYKHASSFNSYANIREESTSILVMSGTTRKLKDNIVQENSTTVWPLWHRHRSGDQASWFFPWLIPLHDEGFRRNYLPLLTLAQGQRSEESSRVNVLWRTISYARDKAGKRFSLSFLFSYERGEGYRQVGVLSDLLHFRWSTDIQENP